MRLNQITDRLTVNTNEDMHWILISENLGASEHLKACIPSNYGVRCKFLYPLSEFVQNRSELASEITKAAANSMLFTLIFDGEIKTEYHKNLYKLFFHLKNLGFCRVIVTRGDNEKIAAFCHELNVYYEALDAN